MYLFFQIRQHVCTTFNRRKDDGTGTEEHQRAFEEVRQLCQQRFLLVPLRKGAKLSLHTEASDVAAGGALVQDGGVVEFFSKRFTQTE